MGEFLTGGKEDEVGGWGDVKNGGNFRTQWVYQLPSSYIAEY